MEGTWHARHELVQSFGVHILLRKGYVRMFEIHIVEYLEFYGELMQGLYAD
jgi:hypothetical protein